jgi:hypothetical protein
MSFAFDIGHRSDAGKTRHGWRQAALTAVKPCDGYGLACDPVPVRDPVAFFADLMLMPVNAP